MKKQNSSIKAHLLWSALILLSLLAVCAIPFALAQSRSRGTSKQNVTQAPQSAPAAPNISGTDLSQIPKFPYSSVRTRGSAERPAGQSKLPTKTSGPSVPNFSLPPVPKLPAVTLYDQLNNPGSLSTSSQDFETANDAFDNQGADDFVVPAGPAWRITEVDAQGVYFNGPGPASFFDVFFYLDAGTLRHKADLGIMALGPDLARPLHSMSSSTKIAARCRGRMFTPRPACLTAGTPTSSSL